MNTYLLVIFGFCICGANSVLAQDRPALAERTPLTEYSVTDNLTRYIAFVKTNTTAIPGITSALEQQLVGSTYIFLDKRNPKHLRWHSPLERQKACRSIIGETNYTYMQDRFASRLNAKEPSAASEAVSFLCKALVSLESKDKIKSLLDEKLKDLESDSGKAPDPEMLFSVAEGLCYLGDSSGLVVLESAIESSSTTPKMKCWVLEAVASLQDKGLTIRFATRQLESGDALIADSAFDILEAVYLSSDNNLKELFPAAFNKFSNLVVKSKTGKMLTPQEVLLLGNVSQLLMQANRQNNLSTEQRALIKQGATFIISSRSSNEGNSGVAGLFAELADDKDVSLIERMFESRDSRIKAEGILALAHCTKAARDPFTSQLLAFLDDSDRTVKNYALFCLQIHLGEATANVFTEEEFQRNSDRVKNLFRSKRKEN